MCPIDVDGYGNTIERRMRCVNKGGCNSNRYSGTMMSGDDAQHDAEESPAHKGDDPGKHGVGKRVGEFLILALYLAIDAFEIWPHSHLFAVASIPVGVLALMLLDGGFSKKRMAIATGVVMVLCAALYFISPAPLREETETHGWLEPASDPLPVDNACTSGGDVQQLRPNGMLFALGKEGMWFQKKPGGKRPLLTVGICTLMSAEFENNTYFFNADIYDLSHELVARVRRNEFNLVPGKFAYPSRPDRHTLKIFDREGNLLFSIYFRNKDALDVAGTFTCTDGKQAKVEDNGKLTMIGPKARLTWDGQCLINTGGFVVTEYGWGMGQTPCWACDPGHWATVQRLR
jgi:hypothetical protein